LANPGRIPPPDWGFVFVAEAWLPGAGRLPSSDDGGSLKGGAPRAVWSTSENDPQTVSARSVAQTLAYGGMPAHLVWNPLRGEVVQQLPATRAALMISGEAGREGRACLQIMVVGFASVPFTLGPLRDLELVLDWLDSWGVARRWPAGPPPALPAAYQTSGDRRCWARGGHFGHSQVPGCQTPGPGGIDIHKLTGPEPVPPELPGHPLSSEQLGLVGTRALERPLEAAGGI
jgi:hypothetical protein